jgi:hypothetical protein
MRSHTLNMFAQTAHRLFKFGVSPQAPRQIGIIKLELSRQQPRRPVGASSEAATSLPVPRGHMEWKDGQNWVILTAFRTGTKEPVTLEFTLWQWLRLIPVRYAVEERLERWQWSKALQRGKI